MDEIKVLLINGPNLNLTGFRQPEIYGYKTLKEIECELRTFAEKLCIELECFQSNSEGAIIDRIQNVTAQGIVINPGAYAHYSYAIRDAIIACPIPTVEVHMSNIYKREAFRHTDVIADVCEGHVVGLGQKGYEIALRYLANVIKYNKKK